MILIQKKAKTEKKSTAKKYASLKKKLHSSEQAFDENDYLTEDLIAYIGNKRRLLPLLDRAVTEIVKNGNQKLKTGGLFVDYFSGTGVVSRLAALRGFRVVANDWEDYAAILSRAFLCTDQSIFDSFENEGGFEEILQNFNALKKRRKGVDYRISETYCPSKNNDADPNDERMFYTPSNGVLIDNIRHEIAQRYAGKKIPSVEKHSQGKSKGGRSRLKNTHTDASKRTLQSQHDLLLALLLVQASKRSNTSGVFKAYHHGFGGRKQDALTRILHPVELGKPTLLPPKKKLKHKVFKADALRLVGRLKRWKAEIVYLDPPYNQHQYGSNYHLLNTIARGDDPGVSKKPWPQGMHGNKAGIRKDWIKTRSGFCSKKTAFSLFADLVKQINAKYLMVSYSTEGMIDFNAMLEVLKAKGRIAIVTEPYVRYRGGRQSNSTAKKNVEFVLIVDTSLPCRNEDVENVHGVLVSAKMQSLLEENLPILPIYEYAKNTANNRDKSNGEDWHLQIVAGEKKRWRLHHKPSKTNFTLTDKLTIDIASTSIKMEGFVCLQKELEALFAKPNHEKVAGILQAVSVDPLALNHKYLLGEAFRLAEKINAIKTPREYHAMLQWLGKLRQQEVAESFYTRIEALQQKMEKILVEKIFSRLFS